jgi:hypothetical protein
MEPTATTRLRQRRSVAEFAPEGSGVTRAWRKLSMEKGGGECGGMLVSAIMSETGER